MALGLLQDFRAETRWPKCWTYCYQRFPGVLCLIKGRQESRNHASVTKHWQLAQWVCPEFKDSEEHARPILHWRSQVSTSFYTTCIWLAWKHHLHALYRRGSPMLKELQEMSHHGRVYDLQTEGSWRRGRTGGLRKGPCAKVRDLWEEHEASLHVLWWGL